MITDTIIIKKSLVNHNSNSRKLFELFSKKIVRAYRVDTSIRLHKNIDKLNFQRKIHQK